jgi:hypothetical protein
MQESLRWFERQTRAQLCIGEFLRPAQRALRLRVRRVHCDDTGPRLFHLERRLKPPVSPSTSAASAAPAHEPVALATATNVAATSRCTHRVSACAHVEPGNGPISVWSRTLCDARAGGSRVSAARGRHWRSKLQFELGLSGVNSERLVASADWRHEHVPFPTRRHGLRFRHWA